MASRSASFVPARSPAGSGSGTGSCTATRGTPRRSSTRHQRRQSLESGGGGLMGFRVSVDTGGTFTDVVVADDAGAIHVAKAPTELDPAFQSIEVALGPLAPTLGVAVSELLARTDVFTYGTTRATNAVVEGRTARTALFTTAGFPDVLLLREGGKLDPFRQLPYPGPYVPRHLTFEIRERIDSEGEVF